MKALITGLGGCGNRITNEFFVGYSRRGVYGARRRYLTPFAIDTDKADLAATDFVSRRRRMLVGLTSAHGHGLGGDSVLGRQIATDESVTVGEKMRILGADNVDAVFLITGLGGGTGSGIIPVLAGKLRETFIGIPVIAVGILPARSEGELATLNAARSLATLTGNVDGLIVVDNEKFLHYGRNVHETYRIVNGKLARMVRLLAEASEGSKAGEKVLDAADILNTLCGSPRIAAILEHGAAQGKGRLTGLPRAEFSTIGYASDPLPTWPIAGIRRKTDPVWRARRIPELAKAASADCLVDMEPENAGQNLILAIGPQDEIDAEGFMATRDWLGKYSTIGEVRAGDYPVKSKMLEVIVVFSGLTKIHRVTEILDAGK